MLCSGGLQGTLEVIRDFHNFSFERERTCRVLRRRELRRVETRDAKDCYTKEQGNGPTCFPLAPPVSRSTPGEAVRGLPDLGGGLWISRENEHSLLSEPHISLPHSGGVWPRQAT
jgi:hypothetical protein